MSKSRAARSIALACGLLGFVAAAVPDAFACPLCFSGLVITPGQKLDSADEAVIAVPDGGAGDFRVAAVIKGNPDPNGVIRQPSSSPDRVGALTLQMKDAVSAAQEGAAAGSLLLVRNRLTDQWTSLGPVDEAYTGWLRQVAATDRPDEEPPARSWPQTAIAWSTLSDAEWRERLVLIVPQLESDDPLVAEFAHGELARAPYGLMRALKPALDAGTIAGWVADPRLAQRRAAYLLLLGIAGGPNEASAVEAMIDAALESGDATDLAAMLAADLEMRGTDRVAWIEQTFFADPLRTLPEIEAARLALSVHGAVDGDVRRARIAEAFRFFIHERAGMAGFVASDLADWKVWDVTGDYIALLQSGRVRDPASQLAIVTYLRESPDTAAPGAVEAFTGAAN
jgi:hypothetical protein